jgi:ribosomal-protein-alanine N-acetyltransferase
MDASLRPATEDDLDPLAKLEARMHTAPWTREHFEKELEKSQSRIWVMTDDETDTEILGYIVFWNMNQEVHILNVVVDRPYRGLGHAQRMVRQVVNEVIRDGIQRVTLEVRHSNKAAIGLYQKLGFVITQVRKAFYSNGEDAYLMELPLKEGTLEF